MKKIVKPIVSNISKKDFDSYCSTIVKNKDFESYLTGLLFPSHYRDVFFAIRAFNVEVRYS